MVVEASYYIGSIEIATTPITGYSVTPAVLTDGTTHVIITYSEGGVTCTATQDITVKQRLTSIEIITLPTVREYEYLDTLDTIGMKVQAHYSDGTQRELETSEYTCSPTTFNAVGTQNVTVAYAENGISRETTYEVTVNRKSVPKPSWASTLTYNGQNQVVTDPSYWTNYNTEYMTIGGNTSGTNAGTYTAIFALNSNYRWNDGSIDTHNVDWSISRAAGSLSVSPNSISVGTVGLSGSTTITRSGTGAISYSPTTINGLTLNLVGDVLTVTADGSTPVPATEVTISVAADQNYTAPASVTITVAAVYWEWGDENAIGNDIWWAGLKTWAAGATAEERAACVGKTKKVSLSTTVLGANAATMLCIGSDQDGANTLAFQTKGTLPPLTTFGSSAVWIDSSSRTQCQNFYNYCSAKSAIKTVKKGTCPSMDNSRNGSVTYNDETVWLPSEREMGLDEYAPISTANSTTSKAECTQGYNAAYKYYTSNGSRKKFAMDANGNVGTDAQLYWERSRCYNSNNSIDVCRVRTDGSTYYTYNYSSSGLAPAFVIG